jgi:uncharacterized membrane-anchored protein YhcB (DUF1043 family)
VGRIEEMILYFLFVVAGIMIGLAIRVFNQPVRPKDELEKEIDKLKSELVVYQNLKDSLLADVRYWRNKAEGK